YDLTGVTDYAIRQQATGRTDINASSGQLLVFLNGGLAYASLSNAGFSIGSSGTRRTPLRIHTGSGGNQPGYIELESANGTEWFLFIEDDGTLKIHSAAPSANTDGTEVGSQS